MPAYHDRETHPAPAAVDRYGQRQFTPEPAAADIVRNFGGDYGSIYDKPAANPQED